ncbi:MAG: hypothetical protein PHC30_09100 [Lentisphaeria bacterium]|nr:hypothetical protein [Lentisphaeria bacterium]
MEAKAKVKNQARLRFWLVGVLLLLAWAPLLAEEVACRFGRDQWSAADWVLVKSPRWDYFGGWVQQDDHLMNEHPADATPKEMLGKRAAETYTSMVYRHKVSGRTKVSATLLFEDRMAPELVLAGELGLDAKGRPEYREHWEIVLYDEGINVWHHEIRDGKPFWRKAAYLKTPFQPGVQYTLEALVEFPAGGKGPQLSVTCDGKRFGCLLPTLPEPFHVGVTACEGVNRFYDFKLTTNKIHKPEEDR